MRRLHSLLLIILMVSALPWGAYARVLPGVAPIALAAPSSQQSVTHLEKRCRIAALPGAPCGPDHVILAGAANLTLPPARNPQPAPAHITALEYEPETPRAPPRSG
jgi:hypothetical protein